MNLPYLVSDQDKIIVIYLQCSSGNFIFLLKGLSVNFDRV